MKANISRFVERSRTVWDYFQKIEAQPVHKVISFENFLAKNRSNEKLAIPTENPFLNFKFDR